MPLRAPHRLRFSSCWVVALAVAAGAGWYGYVKSMETVDVESLDLSKGDTPRSTHVAITGIANRIHHRVREKDLQPDDTRPLHSIDSGELAPGPASRLFHEDQHDGLYAARWWRHVDAFAENAGLPDHGAAGRSGS